MGFKKKSYNPTLLFFIIFFTEDERGSIQSQEVKRSIVLRNEKAGPRPLREGAAGNTKTAIKSGENQETGAGDEVRTRDPYLGKVMLYH